jgi:hypothetical protein
MFKNRVYIVKKHCQYNFRSCEALSFKFLEASTRAVTGNLMPIVKCSHFIMSELIYTQNMLLTNSVDTLYNLSSYYICDPYHSSLSVVMLVWLSEFILLNYN